MRLRAVQPSLQCPHYGLKAFAALVPSSVSHSRKRELDRTISSIVLSKFSNPFNTLFKLHNFSKTSKVHAIRRSHKSNMDEVFDGAPSYYIRGSAKSSGEEGETNGVGHGKKKLHCVTSQKSPFGHETFSGPRFDFLEPMMLGIKPEFPDWPDQETVVWATIEQKAKSLDIPLSLRMIKKKLQSEEAFTDRKDSAYCAVKSAFSSMVFIVIELQSCALQMRESLCSEDLEVITSKVQKDMHSSFVWLFQQVFSRTPDLMLHVLILLANFSVYSASRGLDDIQEIPFSRAKHIGSESHLLSLPPEETSTVYPCDASEYNLWNSIVDDALKMKVNNENEVLDQVTKRYLVSPVSVEIEPDAYEDYLRTDLLYQMNLSLEPSNSLLLCNYAQFLHLVAKDYDRAEECFKRAVQASPPEAESLIQYANFLWAVRKDSSGAEERFLQALACEPENSYYSSKYASFLWSTGGDETCFPLNSTTLHDL